MLPPVVKVDAENPMVVENAKDENDTRPKRQEEGSARSLPLDRPEEGQEGEPTQQRQIVWWETGKQEHAAERPRHHRSKCAHQITKPGRSAEVQLASQRGGRIYCLHAEKYPGPQKQI